MISKCSEHLATTRKEGGSRSRGCLRRKGVEEEGGRGAGGSRDEREGINSTMLQRAGSPCPDYPLKGHDKIDINRKVCCFSYI